MFLKTWKICKYVFLPSLSNYLQLIFNSPPLNFDISSMLSPTSNYYSPDQFKNFVWVVHPLFITPPHWNQRPETKEYPEIWHYPRNSSLYENCCFWNWLFISWRNALRKEIFAGKKFRGFWEFWLNLWN